MAKPSNTITEYRNYYLPLNFPVLLISGEYWKISDVPSGRLHFHNCLEIGICHSERGTMEFYGEPREFKEGDVTCIPRNIPHTTYSAKGTESLWSYIFFDPVALFRNLLPMGSSDFDLSVATFQNFQYILGRNDYPQVYFLVTSIIRELEDKKTNYQSSAKGLLLALYVELLRIQTFESVDVTDLSQAPENMLIIAPALDYIETNYMQQFTIEFLADLCHWSPTHFRRVFLSIMGTSPLNYLNNTRIMKAGNLLRSTQESILDISEMVGFHSVSSFNRYFTRIMQMPPREYREKMLQKEEKSKKISILEFSGWTEPENATRH